MKKSDWKEKQKTTSHIKCAAMFANTHARTHAQTIWKFIGSNTNFRSAGQHQGDEKKNIASFENKMKNEFVFCDQSTK